ncbi:medium-chain fatty acid-CoA ligase faa2, partial [Linderina pennispora]
TLYGLFQRCVSESPADNLFGSRAFDPDTKTLGDHYTWLTKKQAAEFVDHYGSGLDHTFAQFTDKKAGEQAPIGVYSCNRAEWHLTEFSTYRGNRYFVSLYDTLGDSSVEYVLNHAEIEVLVCSVDKIARLLDLKERVPSLKVLVSMDALDGPPKNVIASETSKETISALKERAKALGVELTDIDTLVEQGRTAPTDVHPPTPTDLCSISYTSGTSGNPKGVLSTHGQFMKSANAVRLVITLVRPVTFSLIPLAHCFERLVSYFTLSKFGCIGYYSGKVPNFLEDIQALKPTLFAAVPRLLNRVYDKVSGAIGSATGIKGFLARTAVSHKLASFESSGSYRHALWDALVFNKVRAVLGGRIETLVVGSAPMDLEAIKFLQIAMCCVVIQGFGMTETNTCGMIETVEESVTNSVGRPKPGMSVRLRDCPEMNYQSTDKPCPRGELLLKGDAIMTGYYKNDELTKESFKDGWLYTGDIAQINPNGTISIIDRCKNIFKLSQGEYIAPDYLQIVYDRHSLVQQTFVHGDSNRSALVAIVVPDPEAFVPWAREIAKDSSAELEALSSNPQVNEALLKTLIGHGRDKKLQGFEIIRAIHIEPTPFDIDKNQLLSNTLKLKRHFAAQYYRETIDKLYNTLSA